MSFGLALAMLVASPRRILLTGSRAALDAALAAVQRTDPADWERACIEDGEPWITPATAALWLPQMLNLDLLGAISFTKGCYTGQEIVARTQNLGRIKRRTLRYAIAGGEPPAPLTALHNDGVKVGEVLQSARVGSGSELLAVVALEARDRPPLRARLNITRALS